MAGSGHADLMTKGQRPVWSAALTELSAPDQGGIDHDHCRSPLGALA